MVCVHLLAEEILIQDRLNALGNNPEPEVEESERLRQTAVECLGDRGEGRLVARRPQADRRRRLGRVLGFFQETTAECRHLCLVLGERVPHCAESLALEFQKARFRVVILRPPCRAGTDAIPVV